MDSDGNGYISQNEFMRHFGVQNLNERPKNSSLPPSGSSYNRQGTTSQLGQQAIEKTKWAQDYYEEIDFLLKAGESNFEKEFYEKLMDKNAFKRKLESFGMGISQQEMSKFVDCFTDYNDYYKVDTSLFGECLDHYSRNPSKSNDFYQNKHVGQICSY